MPKIGVADQQFVEKMIIIIKFIKLGKAGVVFQIFQREIFPSIRVHMFQHVSMKISNYAIHVEQN